uniref:Uncharacterized protein n=1 Tax=viral metagenome TaxID=1070528 RepID=A0A6C0AR44_9ZZZZ
MDSSDDSNKSFLKHVFNFDDDSKSEIINIIQYALLAIIPIVLLNKSIAKYVPEADDKKGSLEITAEILIQIIIMFMGLLLINRLITFVPTYSGAKYPETHIIQIILSVLMITMSLQTKLGEKVGILVDRIVELWDGKTDKKKKNGKNGTVKVSQPISGQTTSMPITGGQPSYTDGTAISALPNYDQSSSTTEVQQSPNFNAMFRQDTTPLVGAATPGGMDSYQEPMAANSVLGGSAFGSAW